MRRAAPRFLLEAVFGYTSWLRAPDVAEVLIRVCKFAIGHSPFWVCFPVLLLAKILSCLFLGDVFSPKTS